MISFTKPTYCRLIYVAVSPFPHFFEGLGDVLLQEEHDFRGSEQFRLLEFLQVGFRRDFADDFEQIIADTRAALRFEDVQVVPHFLDGFYLGGGHVEFLLEFDFDKNRNVFYVLGDEVQLRVEFVQGRHVFIVNFALRR